MNPDGGVVTDLTGARFKLRVLGYPVLSAVDGSHVAGLGPGKPLALLAYLAVRREARRDELVDLLWGGVSEANARNAFRQALHRLRTGLGEQILPLDRDKVELNVGAGLDTDGDVFVEALEAGDIASAVQAYRGDFLEGFEVGEPVFDSWVDAERMRLKGRFQLALQAGAEAALAAGRWLEALQYVQRLTGIAPYDEAAALLEANVLVAAGRGSEALMTLRRFAQTLRDQLDLQPSAKVREMISRIERADHARETAIPPRAVELPFVGREQDIAAMMACVRAMSEERGTTVSVEGGPGMGKSRLVSEFISRARSLGPLLVLRGRERPTSASLPYASIAEALRGGVRAPGVAGTGRHLLSEAARILPELRDTFDLPEPPPIDAEGGRLRFFEGIAALLDSAAYEQPVCLVLDDMHHASPSTVDLVGYLSARLRSSPVLIVLIHRELDAGSPLASLTSDSGLDAERNAIRLAPLEPDAVRQLVERIVASAADAGPLDIDRVAGAAGGNPLRAIELARRALNGELPSVAPVALRDILWSRFQKASPSQRRVFFAAALLQRRCSLRLLAAAAHLPEVAALDAAHELEGLGLLVQEADAYVVAHDFTSAFVTDTSGLAGRALLAGWAADALASEPRAPSDELANLYALAGQQGAAFTHARRAVYDAAALGSAPEVQRLIGFALAIAPDPRTRTEAEAMLAAFGAGKKLLEAPTTRTSAPNETGPDPVASATAVHDSPPVGPADRPQPQSPSRSRRFLTGRLAVIVVIGLIATAAADAYRRSVTGRASGTSTLRDSLLVVQRGSPNGDLLVITGALGDASRSPPGVLPPVELPAWLRDMSLPWIRPTVSPSGIIAIERMTGAGTDVYLMPGPDADPVPVAIGGGIDAILGWSPDGANLLVRRTKALADGAFDADLWAFRLQANRVVSSVPIDESTNRSVEEASWSPDGSRVAWVAQIGPAHQRDIFVSRADGSGVENITENPGEDYHLAWASSGNLLAFTSDRDGNPDLFAIELEGDAHRLWRLTDTPAAEDFASFSPDQRFVAFQSTAEGDAAVWVMASLGGQATRVTPPGGQFSIAGWKGRPPVEYVDRFRIIGPSSAALRDSIIVSLFGADRNGNTVLPDAVTLWPVDDAAASVVLAGADAHTYVIRPQRDGPVTLVASIPGWRTDTLTIEVGRRAAGAAIGDFTRGIASDTWTRYGSPRPFARTDSGGAALYPNADIEWQSGVLSRSMFSLRDSLDISATLRAPFSARPVAAALLTVGLVNADAAPVDSVAPQPEVYIGVTWDGETSRFTYSVGQEAKSDPVSALGIQSSHAIRIVLGPSGTVSFFVDSRLRWRSSLRFLGNAGERRARIWIGGRATGSSGSVSNFVLRAR